MGGLPVGSLEEYQTIQQIHAGHRQVNGIIDQELLFRLHAKHILVRLVQVRGDQLKVIKHTFGNQHIAAHKRTGGSLG